MKSFDHKRPIRDDKGDIIGERPAPVWRRTARNHLADHHGTDKNRHLAVGLLPTDEIAIRPAGTRREPLKITPSALYDYLVRCEANKANLVKAREKKERKAIRLARQRQERAEKRLTRPL